MNQIFYIGFFMVNLFLSIVLLNILDSYWLKQNIESNDYFVTFMSLLYSIGITLCYIGVFR